MHDLNCSPSRNDARPNMIRKYRERKYMSQKELAEKTGISRQCIAALERRGNKPRDPEMAQQIAKVLDVSMAQLFGDIDESPYIDSGFYTPKFSGTYLCAFRKRYSSQMYHLVLWWDADLKEWRLLDTGGSPTNDLFKGKVLYWMEIPVVID